MEFFRYGPAEMEYLKSRDKKLGAVIDRFGFLRREISPDLFSALVESVIGQQISPKAAVTVCGRLQRKAGAVTPEIVAGMPAEDIQKCGMSLRKASNIQKIGQMVAGGEFDLSGLAALPDGEVIKSLSSLPGIGVWTAEMLLIFSLQRPDVVSFGDLAIRNGMRKIYGLDSLTKEAFRSYRERYSPYGSIASFYLWAAAHESE